MNSRESFVFLDFFRGAFEWSKIKTNAFTRVIERGDTLMKYSYLTAILTRPSALKCVPAENPFQFRRSILFYNKEKERQFCKARKCGSKANTDTQCLANN